MKRFKTLDVFRGMTVCLMIVVNTPGSWSATFSPLLHASWHGFTPTDLVFPSFLFAVGASLGFVGSKWAKMPDSKVLLKIFKRSLIIFLIGYFTYWFPFVEWTKEGTLAFSPFSETRVFGVLQRIALCYLFGALLIFYVSLRNLYWLSFGFLLLYWGIMYWGGDYSLEGNFARSVDLFLIGEGHMYKGEGLAFDPEGLLSTLPSIVNVIGGYLVAHFLIKNPRNYESLAKLMLVGTLLMLGAYVWSFAFPINKKIWTSSYVLLTIGMDILWVALIMYSLEFMSKPLNYYFFEVFGKNPLFIYLLSIYLVIALLFFKTETGQSYYGYIYENAFLWIGKYYASLAFALVFMMICWLVGWLLDRWKIYIRV